MLFFPYTIVISDINIDDLPRTNYVVFLPFQFQISTIRFSKSLLNAKKACHGSNR